MEQNYDTNPEHVKCLKPTNKTKLIGAKNPYLRTLTSFDSPFNKDSISANLFRIDWFDDLMELQAKMVQTS